MTGDGVLVIGYGNSLRTDDGAGWHAAMRLADDPRLAGARVLARHQLTPELAADVARASLAIFIDARQDGSDPGSIVVQPLEPSDRPTAWTHHAGPATILGLARALYVSAPPAVLVSIAVACLDVGDRLSPRLQTRLPSIVNTIARLVQQYEPARR